ncbi:hypothetical protein SPONN_1131 [uncultured Candidatus Thioglobus sp.]|nr:hypothetical protein SPONN_1131 [uncultured Candidatus Thioglobus sp.]
MSDDNIRQQMFDKHRDASLERMSYNYQAYDKAVLTLSIASLGFSFTFLKFVNDPHCVGWIITSWVLLFLAIIFILFSFCTGNKAIEKNIENAREYYLEEKDKSFEKPCNYNKSNTFLNNSAGILFVFGIGLFGIFAIYNI